MNNDSLRLFETESDYDSAKPDFVYPTVSYVRDIDEVKYMAKPIIPIHALPIKAVFYDSSTGSFVKLYPDQITEVNPNYTPIGVEVIPAEHNVYGTGQAGIMSLAEMNYTTPDTGSRSHKSIYWGGYGTNTSLPNYNKVNYIGTGRTLNDCVVQATADIAHLPSDRFSTVEGLDGVSGYYNSFNSYYQAPSPYNADGSRNEAYYTTAFSTANALSDFDGVGNTKVLTDLATGQSDWKTASTITNSYNKGYYPAACCAWRFHTAGTDQGQWYLPACGEMGYVMNRISAINTTINKVLSVYSPVVAVAVRTSKYYWSSSECHADSARCLGDGGIYSSGKDCNLYYVRAFLRV